MKENKVITDIEQLTPEWLTEIFKKKGIISNGRVTKILKKKSQKTISSNVHFLEVEFFKDAQMISSSLGIVVKITKSAGLWGKLEVDFYNIIAENMDNMPIPICYDGVYSEITGWGHKMLEDLSPTHETIQGISPPPKRYCEMTIDTLAELHAFWWDHKKLEKFLKNSHVLYTFKEGSFNENDIFKWFDDQKRLLNRLTNQFGDRISEKTIEMLNSILAKFPQLVYKRLKKENLTIIHGDAHFWQFFHPKDSDNKKNKSILSDWMMWSVGVGAQDLAYLIGTSLFPNSRHIIEKYLIKRYHNNLVEHGIENYSWDDCWYDYRLFNLLNIYRGIWWWNVGHPVWWLGLNKAILNIEDLNCMELLES